MWRWHRRKSIHMHSKGVCMAVWDIMWTTAQRKEGLIISIFFRYIDDLRILMLPTNHVWKWYESGWQFDSNTIDTREMSERT